MPRVTECEQDLPEGLQYRQDRPSLYAPLYKELRKVQMNGRWYCVDDLPTTGNDDTIDVNRVSSAVRLWAKRNLPHKFLIKPDPDGKGNGGKPAIFVKAVDPETKQAPQPQCAPSRPDTRKV